MRDKVNQVSEADNIELVEEITEDEVKEVVFSIHPDKSPGPDGLTPAFFQSFWNVVRHVVILFFQTFMSTSALLDGVNKALVCLISKVKVPRTIADLRSISLC